MQLLEIEQFDIGVAIHACGWMTDFVQSVCLRRNASYVLCSCCVGKLCHPGPPEAVKNFVLHPRSKQFKDRFSREEFLDMCKKADIDFYSNDLENNPVSAESSTRTVCTVADSTADKEAKEQREKTNRR